MRFTDRLSLVGEGVWIALEAIRGNKVRAFLTISGVAVGVLVVVLMAATTTGIERSFKADVDSFGATTFTVRRRDIRLGSCSPTDDTCTDRRNPAISDAEREAIRRLSSVYSATDYWVGNAAVKYRDRVLTGVGYEAMSGSWLDVDKSDITPGRNFSASEASSGARVVLVNDTLRARLFGDSDPVGKAITVDGAPFTVIGVYQPAAGFLKSLEGRGPDRPGFIIPYATAREALQFFERNAVLRVKPRDDVPQSLAMDEVTATLRAMRGLRPGQVNDFALVTNDRLLETFDKLFGAIFLVGLGLSAVGLLVGGVGVVAIMMISVTERTREIGVRKALGATRGQILWQFLVEAATLTTIGASIGLVLGWGIASLVKAFTPVPAAVPLTAVVLALVGSALTGIVFGILPAGRAAKMDPIEALRHE